MAVSLGDAVLYLTTDNSGVDQGLRSAESKTKGWASSLGGKVGPLLGGAVIGGATLAVGAIAGIGTAAFNVSRDVEVAAADLAASLGLPTEKAQEFAEVARQVYGNNFADSVGDAADAVGLVAQQLGVTADDPALQTITENAFRLRDAFGVDVADSIDAVRTLTEQFGIDSEQAFDLVTAGFQSGLDRSGDFLDTIGEYSTQFASGGASAEEFFGLLDSGLQGGVLGTDKAADAFKEFRLRIQDGSKLTAESLESIGLNVDSILTGLSDGSLTTADAFDMVTSALGRTEDPVTQFNAGVGLLGSQFEDLGDAALGLELIPDYFEDVGGATDALNAKYETFGQAVTAIWRRLTTSVSPFIDKLLELVNNAVPHVLAAFDSFDRNVGPIMERTGQIIQSVVGFVRGLFEQFRSSVDVNALGPLQYWQDWADQNLPRLRQLFETILGAITTFWQNNGDQIMTIVNNTFNTIWTVIDTVMRTIGDLVTLYLQVLSGDWEGAGATIQGIVERLWDTILVIFNNYIGNLQTAFQLIDWGSVGRSIMDGIAAGIRNGAGLIVDAATSAARQAFDAAKAWLGIGSPSKKFRELGEFSAEGYAEGISRNMTGMNSRVTGSLNSMFSSLQPAAAGGTQTYNISVNLSGSAGYEDGRMVGRGILDELRARGAA